MAGCQSKSKETPARDPQQIPLENKVVNKIIAPVTNEYSFKKGTTIT
jgi:hypothetical protein